MSDTLMIPATDFNPSTDINYTKPRINKAGGKAVNINNNNNRMLHLSMPLMLTWGVNTRVDDQSGRVSYDMSLQFPKEEYATDQTKQVLNNMIAFEEQIKADAIKNSKDWFNKAKLTEAQVDVLFNPMLYWPKDADTGERREGAAPTLRLKIDCWDGEFKCEIYDVNQESLYPGADPNVNNSTPDTLITKGCHVATIIRCGGVYFVNGKFGVTWRLHQALVKPKATLSGKCFISLSTQEKDTLNKLDEEEDDISDAEQTGVVPQVASSDEEDETPEVSASAAAEVAEEIEPKKTRKKVVRRKKTIATED